MLLGLAVGNYMLYSWIALPCFSVILLGLSGTRFRRPEPALLKTFCRASYVFFLAQLFSNAICRELIACFGLTGNVWAIILGWGACALVALTLRCVEKPLSRWCRMKVFSLLRIETPAK